MIDEQQVWQALEAVKDPEIPVVSVVEMGIVREVTVSGDAVTVTMTPTFSGCPALHVIEEEIAAAVRALGAGSVAVDTSFSPPWSSEWMSAEARQKLKQFGLAPPPRHDGHIPLTFYEPVPCPRCDSQQTSVRNTFGSTLCRAIYYCHACGEPFEQFKAL